MSEKKLYRSVSNRVIAGVCGGIGEYFEIDPVIIRVLFVVAALGGGFGVLMYIVLWIVIPEYGTHAAPVAHTTPQHDDARSRNTLAWVLLVFGVAMLFNNFFPRIDLFRLWPLVLIIAAVSLLKRSSHE